MLHRPPADQLDAPRLDIPCGGCTGCRADSARAWALRCWLELQEHSSATFATLTYADEHLPPRGSLRKDDLQRFWKRLRNAAFVRYFGCGEYGETTQRPHYHAIIYGLGPEMQDVLEYAWKLGHVRADAVSPASIAYVAGYTQKKLGVPGVYRWREPPFRVMSRNPGIGASAMRHPGAWAEFAVDHRGRRMRVPRYYAEKFAEAADPQLLEELEFARYRHMCSRPYETQDNRDQAELLALARQRLAAQRRQKL